MKTFYKEYIYIYIYIYIYKSALSDCSLGNSAMPEALDGAVKNTAWPLWRTVVVMSYTYHFQHGLLKSTPASNYSD